MTRESVNVTTKLIKVWLDFDFPRKFSLQQVKQEKKKYKKQETAFFIVVILFQNNYFDESGNVCYGSRLQTIHVS